MISNEDPPPQQRTPRSVVRRLRPHRATAFTAAAAAVLVGAGLLTFGTAHSAPQPQPRSPHASPHVSPPRLPTSYVALGDSYASGPGIPTQIDLETGCDRSDHSYPVLVAARLGLDAQHFRDASCSGATIADLTGPQSTGAATTAPAQLSALSADTALVTLGIGGNDLGFASVLTRCAALDAPGLIVAQVRHAADSQAPCRASYTAGGEDRIAQKIPNAATELAAVLARIHHLAPHARVLIIGYPDLLPATAGESCAMTVGVTPEDAAYLNSEEVSLNAALKAQAAAAGDGYIDTYTTSTGHDACAEPAARWIEPLLTGGRSAPAAPMHPNAVGQQAIAELVDAAVTGRAR